MTEAKSLKLSLLLLRVGVFIVFFMWTIDKFINPEHSARVFAKFYYFQGLATELVYVIGLLQAAVVLAFLLGIMKKYSYGIIFLMHLASTLVSFEHYFDPWKVPNLLFFAAFPMLAAIMALYLMRDQDTMLTIKR
ncbi:hypothetical protein [Sessilibacter sp. MAH4]